MNTQELDQFTTIPRRSPDQVMTLNRLGSLHQCRLSFMRQLTRRMAVENWEFTRPHFNIDENGLGYAVYTASYPGGKASLLAFAHDLPDELRSDRVIAEQWDTTFTLFNGVPNDCDIERLKQNVPHQETGRISETELTLSRANRSVRLWEHVVDALAKGNQPDADQLNEVGYLMRTTAVYGSGKFGAADREQLSEELGEMSVFKAPFAVEMLTVYLIRTFVRDLVNHAARCQGGDAAVTLNSNLARGLGIGNSTGLGMAPFLINHPVLVNNWIMAREEAIARVRSIESVTLDDIKTVVELLERTQLLTTRWRSDHPIQQVKLNELTDDLARISDYMASATTSATDSASLQADFFWNQLIEWSETNLSIEGQECIASLMLEPYGDLVDGLSHCMDDPISHTLRIDGTQSVSEVSILIENSFGWANDIDWTNKDATARCWYVSVEKLEPRLGERYEEPLANYEQPLAPARDAMAALSLMKPMDSTTPVAEFLVAHPEHRRTVQRAQWHSMAPYSEIRDNTIDASMLPIDLLRAKLSFFGATRFDPRSDRWVRICLYPGAPYPEELRNDNSDLWIYSNE